MQSIDFFLDSTPCVWWKKEEEHSKIFQWLSYMNFTRNLHGNSREDIKKLCIYIIIYINQNGHYHATAIRP